MPLSAKAETKPVIKLKASDWKDLPSPGPYPKIWSRRNRNGVFVDKITWLTEKTKLWIKIVETVPYFNDVSFGNKCQALMDWMGPQHKKALGVPKVKEVFLKAMEEMALEDDRQHAEQEGEVPPEGSVLQDSPQLDEILGTPTNENIPFDALESEETFDGENRQRHYSESDSEEEATIMEHNVADDDESFMTENLVKCESNSENSDYEDEDSESETVATETVDQDSPDMFNIDVSQKSMSKWVIDQENQRILNTYRIEDLVNNEKDQPSSFVNSNRYKKSKRNYILTFFGEKSSQEVLDNFTQIPESVRSSVTFKARLNHLKKTEKSERRIVKNLKEMVEHHKKIKNIDSKRVRIILSAATFDPRFGHPDLGETRNILDLGKQDKKNVLSDDSKSLGDMKARSREEFPSDVKELADHCWRTHATVSDPSKQRRKSAIKDQEKMIPNIYQFLSDDEAYIAFKDNYEDQVMCIIKEDCQKKIDKCRHWTKGRDKRIQGLTRKSENFPSKSWFLKQKPKETKMQVEHTTGMCRICHETEINYRSMKNFLKKYCKCNTKECPNFECLCDLDEDGESTDEFCSCAVCECENCINCNVKDLPNSIREYLKSRICPKVPFPFGENQPAFYSPNCVEDIQTCKEICGRKCQELCTKHTECSRGNFPENFPNCHSEIPDDAKLELTLYEYIEEQNTKEGKKPFKRRDAVVTEVKWKTFFATFKVKFNEYAVHQLQDWFLKNIKTVAFENHKRMSDTIRSASDFAMDFLVVRKFESGEQFFYRPQVTIHGTVVSLPIQDETDQAKKFKMVSYMMTTDYKTHDCRTVYPAYDYVLEDALRKCSDCGVEIKGAIHKTDRPVTEYWNSGMVQGHRELAKKHKITIRHISAQAMHNKDSPDGEFQVLKTAVNTNLVQSTLETYFNVKDSDSLSKFGQKFLAVPSKKSKLDERIFFDMKPEEFLKRKDEIGTVKTLKGIKSVFEIIIRPNQEVLWRKYPCFCDNCQNMDFLACTCQDKVGKLKLVVRSEEIIKTDK